VNSKTLGKLLLVATPATFISWNAVVAALVLGNGCSRQTPQPTSPSGSQLGKHDEGKKVQGYLKELQPEANRIVDKYFARGFDALTPKEQVFYCVWAADGEVGNGGMHAVCYNSTGNELTHFPAAFEAIGAKQKANLFQKLIDAFLPETPSQNHEQRVQQHKNLTAAAKSQIETLDDQYHAITENTDALLYQYWIKPPQ
jgi:hypothetical protein